MGKLRWRGILVAAALAGCSQRADESSAVVAIPSAGDTPSTTASGDPGINPRLLRRFQPLPAAFEDDHKRRFPARVDLGRMLYFDTRLSRDGDLSCNSCHDLAGSGADSRRFSVGRAGQHGTRNSPTVFNAAGAFSQFWDGRAPDVEEQARGPILNPVEMGMVSGAQVATTLRAVPGYVEAFHAAFPGEAEPVTIENVGNALGAFERGLVTPGRWDDYLRGRSSALSTGEKAGLKVFLNAGCMVCHTGPLLGGSMFERVGAVEPWPNQEDTGRQQVTKLPADAMMFKVPTLRNVERTAPYFHDGSSPTLEDAVQRMARHQLGLDMSEPEIAAIVVWLKSLTGDVAAGYVSAPTLPPARP